MKRLLLVCLCLGALLGTLCLPAHARMTVGVAPSTSLSQVDQATLDRLGQHFSRTIGTDVSIRRFEDSDVLANWLVRFMELDAALVEPGFIDRFPPGTLNRLVDLHPQNHTQRSLTLIVRRLHDAEQTEALRKVFLSLEADAPGRNLLDHLLVEGVTPPGGKLKVRAAKTTQPPQTEVVTPRPQTRDAVPVVHPAQQSPTTARTHTLDAPTTSTPALAPSKATAEQTPKTTAVTRQEPEQEATAAGSLKAETPSVVESSDSKVARELETATGAVQTKPQEKTAAPVKSPTNKRFILFAALLIFAAILLKMILIAMRWRLKKQGRHTLEDAPSIAPFTPSSEPEETPDDPHWTAPPSPLAAEQTSEDLVVESGRLGPGKVPALLIRCANLPKPVVLRIWKGPCEKLVFFAGGKVSGALTQNADESGSAERWKKLGSLLVREALITPEELNQGLEFLDRQPGLRLGEALLKLGHIDLTRLRHALTRQAKVTLYSMILFPEGNYEVVAGDGKIPPEESVALEINALIREAATHQAEWTTIRQTLPKLNVVLDFTPNGRDKVKNVSLSPLQESILALINGQRDIIGLCSESAMMDYEVYRFLYMMLKADVLEKRTP